MIPAICWTMGCANKAKVQQKWCKWWVHQRTLKIKLGSIQYLKDMNHPSLCSPYKCTNLHNISTILHISSLAGHHQLMPSKLSRQTSLTEVRWSKLRKHMKLRTLAVLNFWLQLLRRPQFSGSTSPMRARFFKMLKKTPIFRVRHVETKFADNLASVTSI
jgi:hypothetical protein